MKQPKKAIKPKRSPPRPAARSAGAKRGPKPDTLQIPGDWQGAVKKSLEKHKPDGGWPD